MRLTVMSPASGKCGKRRGNAESGHFGRADLAAPAASFVTSASTEGRPTFDRGALTRLLTIDDSACPPQGYDWSRTDADAAQRERAEAAAEVNAHDAAIWRWFAALLEERRIRWRCAFGIWEIRVDRTHVANGPTFFDAICDAKREAEELGLGQL